MKLINLSPIDHMHLDVHGDNIITIANIVCKYYGIPFSKISKHDRKKELFKARAMICYLCRDQLKGCPLYIIGYVLGGKNEPYDHASVRHSSKVMESEIHEKTLMDRWANPGLRNEYQVIRGNVIYEINKADRQQREAGEKLRTFVNKDIANRLNGHCESTGITKSMFIRVAVINELNRMQNGVQV